MEALLTVTWWLGKGGGGRWNDGIFNVHDFWAKDVSLLPFLLSKISPENLGDARSNSCQHFDVCFD